MSATDYAVLADQYPEFRLRAHSDRELEDLLDAWFAHDHYDDNPAYSWNDDEEAKTIRQRSSTHWTSASAGPMATLPGRPPALPGSATAGLCGSMVMKA
jgi:hypothetical protein